ncbi:MULTISPECIES: DUF6716 putative glycosyltransferase [unclassified Microbacterium]|uniref:DUF6716 putative glycosyltransferase n=1 Tax=unclassified Microbacterium TaxID=2609290 RepID=UPI000EA907C3|nr:MULTISPECIES: DUF6716 putative glycosyltransferase [unclassified Microbacterium]MBT2483392.1 hypothetical protein [Microbacterium sp. ISL-108]RKN66423.1 hypothetical protein D7252_01625 [Microbacterium sp. CGR2]
MTDAAGLRVVAIADADSFVKWAAALMGSVPGLRPHLLLVRTPLTASVEQQRTALAGTGVQPEDVTRIDFARAAGWLEGQRPDVVLLAGRGPFVRLMGRVIDSLTHRPVTVSGLPGMAIPAQRGALEYRRHTDLLVVHSHRETRAFAELGRRIGVSMPTALATLPFARKQRMLRPERVRVDAMAGRSGGVAVAVGREQPVAVRPPATDIVFAAQALVPVAREERAEIAATLVRAAEADPDRRVVVKLRSRPGESETHLERDPYAQFLPSRRPDNLVFSYDSMASALETAAGLVTVSSTAAIEATAVDVPVIALDSFGVSKSLLNTVFVGSGLLGGRSEVIAGRFRHPHSDWLRDNYFHSEAESNWWDRVQELVALRRSGALPARRVPAARGGAAHEAWQRSSVLGSEERSVVGAAALALGAPATKALAAFRRRGQATDLGTWADASTDYTLEPNPFHDSIRR